MKPAKMNWRIPSYSSSPGINCQITGKAVAMLSGVTINNQYLNICIKILHAIF